MADGFIGGYNEAYLGNRASARADQALKDQETRNFIDQLAQQHAADALQQWRQSQMDMQSAKLRQSAEQAALERDLKKGMADTKAAADQKKLEQQLTHQREMEELGWAQRGLPGYLDTQSGKVSYRPRPQSLLQTNAGQSLAPSLGVTATPPLQEQGAVDNIANEAIAGIFGTGGAADAQSPAQGSTLPPSFFGDQGIVPLGPAPGPGSLIRRRDELSSIGRTNAAANAQRAQTTAEALEQRKREDAIRDARNAILLDNTITNTQSLIDLRAVQADVAKAWEKTRELNSSLSRQLASLRDARQQKLFQTQQDNKIQDAWKGVRGPVLAAAKDLNKQRDKLLAAWKGLSDKIAAAHIQGNDQAEGHFIEQLHDVESAIRVFKTNPDVTTLFGQPKNIKSPLDMTTDNSGTYYQMIGALQAHTPGQPTTAGGRSKPGSAPTAATPKVRVQSAAEAAKLPSGTHFIGPDGVERVRK